MKTPGIKFEVVSNKADQDIVLPRRGTSASAGYDFYASEDIEIPSIWEEHQPIPGGKTHATLIPTGVKAKFPDTVFLSLYSRSSLSVKKGLMLANSVGVTDSDYYNSKENEGEIFFPYINNSRVTQKIRKGERIGQGVFIPFLLTEDDEATGERIGGIGSTGV